MQLSKVPTTSVAQTLAGYNALAGELGYPYFHVSAQLERTLVKMNLVTREEHQATQAMLAKAREEQEELKNRLRKIEEKLNP